MTEAQSFHQLVFCSETEEEKTAPPAGSEQQPQQSSLEGLAGRTALICTETQQDLNASPWLEDNNSFIWPWWRSAAVQADGDQTFFSRDNTGQHFIITHPSRSFLCLSHSLTLSLPDSLAGTQSGGNAGVCRRTEESAGPGWKCGAQDRCIQNTRRPVATPTTPPP